MRRLRVEGGKGKGSIRKAPRLRLATLSIQQARREVFGFAAGCPVEEGDEEAGLEVGVAFDGALDLMKGFGFV